MRCVRKPIKNGSMSKSAVIDAIKAKVERLVADNRKLRDDFRKVSQNRDKLQSTNRELASEVARLEKRVQVLELRESMIGDSENTKAARARVNRLMREVDKCIALLNK